jgi:hypothetical protein
LKRTSLLLEQKSTKSNSGLAGAAVVAATVTGVGVVASIAIVGAAVVSNSGDRVDGASVVGSTT